MFPVPLIFKEGRLWYLPDELLTEFHNAIHSCLRHLHSLLGLSQNGTAVFPYFRNIYSVVRTYIFWHWISTVPSLNLHFNTTLSLHLLSTTTTFLCYHHCICTPPLLQCHFSIITALHHYATTSTRTHTSQVHNPCTTISTFLLHHYNIITPAPHYAVILPSSVHLQSTTTSLLYVGCSSSKVS